MNQQPASRLDSFETALLTELRSVVAAAPAAQPAPAVALRRAARPRRWYAVATAAAVAAVIGLMIANWLRPTPAFAVTGGPHSKVTVHVMRLEGAHALEEALAERGIRADVTYLPQGKRCAPGRYKPVHARGLMLEIGADDFTVTIPPGAVGQRETLILAASIVAFQRGFKASVDFGVARGPVAACRLIPIR